MDFGIDELLLLTWEYLSCIKDQTTKAWEGLQEDVELLKSMEKLGIKLG
jgi:hypothetical protein